jgi:hypothetical protein
MRGLVSQSGGDRAGNDRKASWQAEVTKMIKVYGAPIAEGDVAGIVDYLAPLIEAPAGLWTPKGCRTRRIQLMTTPNVTEVVKSSETATI